MVSEAEQRVKVCARTFRKERAIWSHLHISELADAGAMYARRWILTDINSLPVRWRQSMVILFLSSIMMINTCIEQYFKHTFRPFPKSLLLQTLQSWRRTRRWTASLLMPSWSFLSSLFWVALDGIKWSTNLQWQGCINKSKTLNGESWYSGLNKYSYPLTSFTFCHLATTN